MGGQLWAWDIRAEVFGPEGEFLQKAQNDSISPEILEPLGRQFRVADRMLDIFMAEIVLDRPGIVAVIGEFITSGMTQHMLFLIF